MMPTKDGFYDIETKVFARTVFMQQHNEDGSISTYPHTRFQTNNYFIQIIEGIIYDGIDSCSLVQIEGEIINCNKIIIKKSKEVNQFER